LTGGFGFGAFFLTPKLIGDIPNRLSFQQFKRLYAVQGFPPLYKRKAGIQFLSRYKSLGGTRGLIKKSQQLYDVLDKRVFSLVDGLVYMKSNQQLEHCYSRVRRDLLTRGIFFPLCFTEPLYISYSHPSEILDRCAGVINGVFRDIS
ncbi:MAG: hypothetical protein ACOC7U_10215, partial [Spirochaetota bacterium]